MMKEQGFFRVAEYIRLSREDGDRAESDSVGNQKKLIADYLKDKDDFIVYDIYVDDGYTGTNYKRPAFQRMLADIEADRVNCVVVKDLSRFGRDYIDTGKYLERYFPDKGVRFIAITDHIDSLKRAYDLLLPIKNIFNEQYARDISGKVHASLRTKQKAGEFIGAFASYGYRKSPVDKNKLVIDEYAAGIVRRVFQMYIDGAGKNSIAVALNREGIVCPSEYKKRNGENYRNSRRLESTSYWTYSTINRLLQNEIYAGNMVQGRKSQNMRGQQRAIDKDNWIVVKDTHEAVIDKDTWEKAQGLLKRRTRNSGLNTGISLFAGFLKCRDCGRALVKKYGTCRHGSPAVNYYCGTYVRSGRQYCTPHVMPYLVLQSVILEDLQIILRNIEDLHKLVRQSQTAARAAKRVSSNEKCRINTELGKVRKLKQNIYEDYRSGLISKTECVAYRQDYLKKEELLIRQLEDIEGKQDEEASPNIFESPWIKQMLELRGIEKLDRGIIVEMIEEVEVFEDRKIKITYNFSDEMKGLFRSTFQQKGDKWVSGYKL